MLQEGCLYMQTVGFYLALGVIFLYKMLIRKFSYRRTTRTKLNPLWLNVHNLWFVMLNTC
jgi:hypothetical protein